MLLSPKKQQQQQQQKRDVGAPTSLPLKLISKDKDEGIGRKEGRKAGGVWVEKEGEEQRQMEGGRKKRKE